MSIGSATSLAQQKYFNRGHHISGIFNSGMVVHAKGLSTREAGRGHATPHMPVETAKCWWLLKIEPNAWAGGKGSCAVCVDLQAVGALEFFGELYSLANRFWPIYEGSLGRL